MICPQSISCPWISSKIIAVRQAMVAVLDHSKHGAAVGARHRCRPIQYRHNHRHEARMEVLDVVLRMLRFSRSGMQTKACRPE